MMQQGKNLYGQGLQEMGRALRDEKRARSEALLVAPRFMGMFEVSAALFSRENEDTKLTMSLDPVRR